MEKVQYRVLVIEDDPNDFLLVNERLAQSKNPVFEVIRSKHLKSGLDRLGQGGVDAVLLDLLLPDSQGIDSFHSVYKSFPGVPIIILTAVDDDELAVKAIAEGAQDYLTKGNFDRELLAKSICYAIGRHKGQRELQKYYHENEIAKRTLQDRDQRFRSLVSNIPGAVYRYVLSESREWRMEFVSDTIFDICGIPAADFMEKKALLYFEKILPQDLPLLQEAFQKAVREGSSFNVDYRVRHTSGDFRWVHDQGRAIRRDDGQVVCVDGVVSDTTERMKEKERFNRLVSYDALTNLPNRDIFSDRLNQAIQHARRKNALGAVLALDLDHFKRINDTLGHQIGDQLIKAVSARLLKTVYDSDTVTRISGGTFAILLSQITNSADAENAANKILTTFKTPFRIGEHELYTSCSLGIALFPNDGETSDLLIKNADAAMHIAKEQGKERFQLYSSSIATNSVARLALENSLRHALERNEFRLCFQPMMDLRTGKIMGVEALIRWHHPDPKIGIVSPKEFISIAEGTGLIYPIGEWIMKTACEQRKFWDQQGFKSLRLSVNLSARQFHYANLVDMIESITRKIGVDPGGLDFELTESTIMDHMEETVATLRRLKDMGARISVDDFGTGYSSLMYLKTFPIDTLKIDKSFVEEVTTDPDDKAITQAIISMAHSLKLTVVAEGVETKEQLEVLRSQGCDIIQGFLYSKPLSSNEIYAFLMSGAARNPSS